MTKPQKSNSVLFVKLVLPHIHFPSAEIYCDDEVDEEDDDDGNDDVDDGDDDYDDSVLLVTHNSPAPELK